MSDRSKKEYAAMQRATHDPIQLLNAARARLAEEKDPEESFFWKHVVEDLVGRAAERAWTFQLRM